MKKAVIMLSSLFFALFLSASVLLVYASAYTADMAKLSSKVKENVRYGEITYAYLYDIDKVAKSDLIAAGNEATRQGGKVLFCFDTLSNDQVVGRVVVNPSLIKETNGHFNFMLVTESNDLNKVKARFEKLFGKKVAVVKTAHQSFGMHVVICAKLDTAGMDTSKLVAYSYDIEKNSYEPINKSGCTVDSSGFVFLQTSKGGYIIITEKD